MTSTTTGWLLPQFSLQAVRQPWEIFDWPKEQQRSIQRSWAQYLAARRMNQPAQKYFNQCIDDHEGEDYSALYMRSKFNRTKALPAAALEDAKRAIKLAGRYDAHINREMCDVLYELNRFEDAKLLLHDNVRKQVGSSLGPFKERLEVVDENFNDVVGPSLGLFFKEKSMQVQNAKKPQPIDKRPRWKILKQLNECDVESIVEKPVILKSPLENARAKRKRKIYYQTYLNHTSTDVFFLNELRKNPTMLLPQCASHSTARREVLDDAYREVTTFTSMLHARSPLYNENYQRGFTKPTAAKFREANLNRVQYQTRRNMLSILRSIRALRASHDTARLRQFVADVMGDYVVMKTARVMPWKLDFINEVYNHLALSLCEDFVLPATKVSPYDTCSICTLLKIRPNKPIDAPKIVFGDRSTYIEQNITPKSDLQANKRKNLKNRLIFATLPIERAYLLHELADHYLHDANYSQCISYGKRAIDESEKCNSKIWAFLSTMVLVKANAVQQKFERQKEVLKSAYALAKVLKCPRLCTFIELCNMLNTDYMMLRKLTQQEASKRLKAKSRGNSNSSDITLLNEKQSNSNLLVA